MVTLRQELLSSTTSVSTVTDVSDDLDVRDLVKMKKYLAGAYSVSTEDKNGSEADTENTTVITILPEADVAKTVELA